MSTMSEFFFIFHPFKEQFPGVGTLMYHLFFEEKKMMASIKIIFWKLNKFLIWQQKKVEIY